MAKINIFLISALLLFQAAGASSVNQVEAADFIQKNYLYSGEDATILNSTPIKLEEQSYWVGKIQKTGRISSYILVDSSGGSVLKDSEKIADVLETAFVFSEIANLRQNNAFFTQANAGNMHSLANDIEKKTYGLKFIASCEGVDSNVKSSVNALLSSLKFIKEQALLVESAISDASETESQFLNSPGFELKETVSAEYAFAFDEISLLAGKIEDYDVMIPQTNEIIFSSELSPEQKSDFINIVLGTSSLTESRQFNSAAVNYREASEKIFSISKTEASQYSELSVQRISEVAERDDLEKSVLEKVSNVEGEVRDIVNNGPDYEDAEGVNDLFDTWSLLTQDIQNKNFEAADKKLITVSDLISQIKNKGKKPAQSYFHWEVIFGLSLLILLYVGYKYRGDIAATFGMGGHDFDSGEKKEKSNGEKTDEDVFPWEK